MRYLSFIAVCKSFSFFSGQLRVNEEAYEEQRQKLGDAFYPAAGDILTTGTDSLLSIAFINTIACIVINEDVW